MTGTPTGSPPAVVVGVERTDAGRAAVRWAADQTMRRGVRLRLVRALDWPPAASRPQYAYTAGEPARYRDFAHTPSRRLHARRGPADTPPAYGWGARFVAAGQLALDEARVLALGRHPELAVDEALVDGTPATVLRAQSEGAEMLVLGSRYQSAAAELLTTGGIAVPVAAHASCPVAVVRVRRHDGTGIAPLVVVGVDSAEHSGPALEFAFDEASRTGAVLTAVHVVSRLVHHASHRADAHARTMLAESLAPWESAYPDVVVRPQIVHGHAAHTLVSASRNALCVVVGTRGPGGLDAIALGSVSQGLIHHAHCPVVVVPSAAARGAAARP